MRRLGVRSEGARSDLAVDELSLAQTLTQAQARAVVLLTNQVRAAPLVVYQPLHDVLVLARLAHGILRWSCVRVPLVVCRAALEAR